MLTNASGIPCLAHIDPKRPDSMITFFMPFETVLRGSNALNAGQFSSDSPSK